MATPEFIKAAIAQHTQHLLELVRDRHFQGEALESALKKHEEALLKSVTKSAPPGAHPHSKWFSRCLDRAADNEPVFVLCAHDPTATEGVQAWINANLPRLGFSHQKIADAVRVRDEMAAYAPFEFAD